MRANSSSASWQVSASRSQRKIIGSEFVTVFKQEAAKLHPRGG
jgi:GMP synthase PP-ATPase subunit